MKTIVLVTGGFDPLHPGHIEYFKAAKKLGDELHVGLNSDEWLIRKKGRPFILVGPRYYFAALKHPVNVVEYGREKYDVEYEGKKFVEKTFNEHKTKLTKDLRNLILELLDKKLKKLK